MLWREFDFCFAPAGVCSLCFGGSLILLCKINSWGVTSNNPELVLDCPRFLPRANPLGSPPTGLSVKKYDPAGLIFLLVIPAGVEPAIFWMRTRRPRPLDDGTNAPSLLDYSILFTKLQHFRNLAPPRRMSAPVQVGSLFHSRL